MKNVITIMFCDREDDMMKACSTNGPHQTFTKNFSEIMKESYHMGN